MAIHKRHYERTPARMISLTAMFAAFTLVVLYLTVVFPSMKLTFYFLSAVFVAGLLVEHTLGAACIMYVCVSLLSLILLPVSYALPYIILFGHYGIGKWLIERRTKNKFGAMVLKMIYFDIALIGVYFAVVFTDLLPLGEMAEALPIWAWFLILQPIFVLFDFLYSRVVLFYVRSIRKKIVRG